MATVSLMQDTRQHHASDPGQARQSDNDARLAEHLATYFSTDLIQAITFFSDSEAVPLVTRINILRHLEAHVSSCLQTKGAGTTQRESWTQRSDMAEQPVPFLQRVYARELQQGMNLSDLRHLDFDLYTAVANLQEPTALNGIPMQMPEQSDYASGTARQTRRTETPQQERARLSRLLSFRRPAETKKNPRRR